MDTSLEELRARIEKEVPFVDNKPYSSDIVTLFLDKITDLYGQDETDRTIEIFDLEELGWRTRTGGKET